MTFDFAIVGFGAAGIQLALNMIEDDFFKDKSICLFEKNKKNLNKTWSFWEIGKGKYDAIVLKSWHQGWFVSQYKKIAIPFHPYRYKTLTSEALLQYAEPKIRQAPNVVFIDEAVISISDNKIITTQNEYCASHIFDSRMPSEYDQLKNNYHNLIQHFHGWYIKFDDKVLDPNGFTMMDFRYYFKKSTSFIYFLPFSETHALVEFTLFDKKILTLSHYEKRIKNYLEDNYKGKDFEIIKKETGQIPMTDFPFHRYHKTHHMRIGTAGGWVRPSSGYSFKNGERNAQKIIQNIKTNSLPHQNIATGRHRHYDSIFLRVLSENNERGEKIFTQFYNVKPKKILFRFLDETSHFWEEAKIMISLFSFSFIKAFFQTIFTKKN